MDGYELHDARYISEYSFVSSANALVAAFTVTPANRVRTILAAHLYPSVAETQTVFFTLYSKTGIEYAIRTPQSIALSSVIPFPLLTEGMELKLYPGQLIIAHRVAATVGSTFQLNVIYLESDLPFYSYVEPLDKVVRATQKHSTLLRGGGGGGGRSGPGSGPGGGGGGGGPEPR